MKIKQVHFEHLKTEIMADKFLKALKFQDYVTEHNYCYLVRWFAWWNCHRLENKYLGEYTNKLTNRI